MSAGTEVERTFVFESDAPNKIKAAGGRCLGEKKIKDTYFDTTDFSLIRNNFWLRQRNGRWELKYAPLEKAARAKKNKKPQPTSVYREVEDKTEIEALVGKQLLRDCKKKQTLEKMVNA